ncbi:MAG: energy-coupling factor ABC transporter ATP-binding protein [Anaerolineales bacterium]|nr:energy-coupling factor ABC transporter ATP-binding protein [Anaerolineales bacterium]
MIEIDQLSYWYPNRTRAALRDLTLALPSGSITLVAGPSGSGKSTLLRTLNGLVPHFTGGRIAGRLRVAGQDPITVGPALMSRTVGFVFQEPESQRVTDVVEDEIAFALENAAIPHSEMQQRVQRLLDQLALTPLRARSLDTLSGGERQRVAIAAALALRPDLLVLDEPTSQLDPSSADEVLRLVQALNQRWGLTVLMTEHRLERVLPFVDRVVLLDDGRLMAAGPPRELAAQIDPAPPVLRLARALGWQPLPLTVAEARPFAAQLAAPPAPAPPAPAPRDPLLTVDGLRAGYGKDDVLHDVSFSVGRGEAVALMGRNGSGKSSLLRALVGLNRARVGTITVDGMDVASEAVATICQRVGYLPQDPNALLFAETVAEELTITLKNHAIPLAAPPIDPAALLATLGLAAVATHYPRDLSVGQRQRVALGAILVTEPPLLLLDEPTRGLDNEAKATLQALLQRWNNEGMALILVTHDVELAAAVAERVLILDDGHLIADGPAATILRQHPTFTPQTAQLFPDQPWLTPNDLLNALEIPC